MSVTCRRELVEIDAKLMEQPRNCSGISEIVDRWSTFHRLKQHWQQHWLVAQKCRKSMYLMLCVSEQ